MVHESPQVAASGPGGFLPSQTSLPSPAPSTSSSRVAALLPHPRSKPLIPGSRKEDYARDYVARRLLHISRRYVKKFGIPDPADEVTGYESIEEACHDLDEVVDVLWFSGTPSLQVPYLLNVALALNTYLPSFPPAPRPTFALLRKMDHCFASLLVGYDVKTKIPLPGFSSAVDNSTKLRFSRTDMVRCKSLADETRMLVAVVMSGEIDVVDYVEDEIVAQRPARARTEVRSVSVESPDSMSHGFRDIEIAKTEEADDEDSELDFSSVDEEATTKRKADEMTEDIAMPDAMEHTKRIKTEDDEDSSVDLSEIMSTDDVGSKPVVVESPPEKNKEGQFHWALEEDDDDSDDEERTAPVTPSTKVIPSPSRSCNANAIGEEGGVDDTDADEIDEVVEGYDSDEEDEELHMNVGRVYEKTLVQLGQSLGESITDD
ncbi:putative meiotic recombination protein DMC1 [Rosellinia necatrix]|uniref:Putative meiotic recombination protein DMC1 n=1 Tax=Rosellinia necatrix TaxID=77044 RepID=A0A1S7ULF3_ROSNE|nr:putative meiotic recombination protein DMC1 [Rosellinia necatrix]